jgi:hypothetical protein
LFIYQRFNFPFVDTNSNWFESYDIFNPSTNNSLENLNLIIKSKYCDWNQLNIRQFIDISLKIMKDGGAKVPTFGSIFYGTEDSSKTLYHLDLVKSSAEKNYYMVTTENKASSKVIQNFFIEFNIFEDFTLP